MTHQYSILSLFLPPVMSPDMPKERNKATVNASQKGFVPFCPDESQKQWFFGHIQSLNKARW